MKSSSPLSVMVLVMGIAALAPPAPAQEWKPWSFVTYDKWVPWEKVSEQQRRQWNEEYDRQGLYRKDGFVTDTSPEFLVIPEALKAGWPDGMTVAREAPVIDFAPVRGLDPAYFPEDNKSLWSNWAGVGRAPNGKFYFAEGDHRAKESHIYLFEYDPAARTVRKVVDFADLCGWKERGVGDSKIHGDLDIMPDGTLWILTYWDPDPKPTLEQYERWPGSHLVRFDTNTGRAEDLGVLIPKCGWPEFKVDARRGVFFAVGFRNEVLSYDVVKRKINWCGYPPAGITWDNRSSLHDPDTGLFWCVEAGGGGHLVSFDPATNTFMKYPEQVAVPVEDLYSAALGGRFFLGDDQRGRRAFQVLAGQPARRTRHEPVAEPGVLSAVRRERRRQIYLLSWPGSTSRDREGTTASSRSSS